MRVKPKAAAGFQATIYRIWMMRHVDVPEEISAALAKALLGSARKIKGAKPKYIPVVASVSGRSARATLVPAGAGRYRLQLSAALRKAGGADVGDLIGVELRLDLALRGLPVPADLREGLKDHPKAWKAFQKLAPGGRRQFIQWFDSAKGLETRKRRLVRAVDVLLERALLSAKRRK